jgi:hypothetical protein
MTKITVAKGDGIGPKIIGAAGSRQQTGNMSKADIIQLLSNAAASNIDTIKTENLYAFDGKMAFSLGQGQ